MNLGALERFAKDARTYLIATVKSRLELVLAEQSEERRSNKRAVECLEREIKVRGIEQVAEEAAYTWLNRFCAFRFMDANHYTSIMVVSPVEGATQPQLLAEARNGVYDTTLQLDDDTRARVDKVLSGEAASGDPLSDAYRMLFVATCNAWRRTMPFLFSEIDDWEGLLMPDDLLSENSILAKTRAAMTDEDCREGVEIIGWLYQFYISEKKDEVFDGLRRNVKITPENIPAATQLFTPEWIVRYLVENSLGRLWMSLHPESPLKDSMEYYVPDDPAQGKLNVPDGVKGPEDIKVCDPCCGSAHMLAYAFDLLFSMYEEMGYETRKIPGLILEKNLHGLELDPRAVALSSFALAMKARARNRRFFNEGIVPKICCLRNVVFEGNELSDYRAAIGDDLFSVPVLKTLGQFEDAENLGSLITPEISDASDALRILQSANVDYRLDLYAIHRKVTELLSQADCLAPKYHVVVTNPPYMGSKGMNPGLKAFAEENYPDSKSDIFAMFIERCCALAVPYGYVSMVTMQSWMFLSSFEKLRIKLLDSKTILSMAHIGARGFDTIGGEVVSTTAFVLNNRHYADYKGSFIRLVDGVGEAEKIAMFKAALTPNH